MDFSGKVAIVTGGGSGIGRASAVKLAAAGAQVCVADVNEVGGEETVAQIQAAGGQAFFIRCDVSRSADVQAMVESTVRSYGGLDIALNNAGVGGLMGRTEDLSEDDWDLVMNVNLKGVWLCMKYELPHLVARGAGSVINVASLAGLVGFQNNSCYSASKHGVVGLTKSAALEYARRGVRVNAICPGFTDTAMVGQLVDEVPGMAERTRMVSPMRRLGTVDEIADAVLFLAGDTSTFITGQAIALDGGASSQ